MIGKYFISTSSVLLSFFDLETVRANGELLIGVQVTHAEGLNRNKGGKVA